MILYLSIVQIGQRLLPEPFWGPRPETGIEVMSLANTRRVERVIDGGAIILLVMGMVLAGATLALGA